MSDTTDHVSMGLAAQLFMCRPGALDADKPRIYLAGPMSGLPEFNYPAFHAETARLRALGYHVENPADTPDQETWADYMRHAFAKLVTCDRVALLPGWENSSGATKERLVAGWLGIPCDRAEDITERAEESSYA